MNHDLRFTPLMRTVSAALIIAATVGCTTQNPNRDATQYLQEPERNAVGFESRERVHKYQTRPKHPIDPPATKKRHPDAITKTAPKATTAPVPQKANIKASDNVKLEGDAVKLEGN